MTLPILNEIKRRQPDIHLILYSKLPMGLLKSRLSIDFEYIDGIDDFGLTMISATEVDLDATALAYNLRHLDWQNRLAAEAERLKQAKADLMLANIPYVSLAAARSIGLPSIALSSLNWFDLYAAYLSDRPEAAGILGAIREAHAAAPLFLQLAPSLPMASLAGVTKLVGLGPSARIGRQDGVGLRARHGIAAESRVGVIAYGGIYSRLPVEEWPSIPGWTWLVPGDWGLNQGPFKPFENSGPDFPDMLASADLVLTKPGYGTFTEAACNGVAVLAQDRPDWPETPYFDAWMKTHARYLSLPEQEIRAGRIEGALGRLMAMPPPVRPQPSGIAQAAGIILEEIEKLRQGLR